MTVNIWDIGVTIMVAGMLLVFLAVLLMIAGSIKESKGKTRGAAVIFIGPIPFAVATDKTTLLIATILAVGMILILYLYLFGLGG
jgi:uncharacterized membrane protein